MPGAIGNYQWLPIWAPLLLSVSAPPPLLAVIRTCYLIAEACQDGRAV